MILAQVQGNLLEYKLDAFVHQCNCFHTMGAGLAKQVKEKYPELYAADVKHGRRGDRKRLGDFSWARLPDGKIGYNVYGQFGYGGPGRQTSYDALVDGLGKICTHAIDMQVAKIGFPRKMGSDLAGGAWGIVLAIIEEIFELSPLEVFIVNYEK